MPFSDLPLRVAEVRDRIDAAVRRGGHGQQVTLIAVTKTYGPEAVQAAYDAGVVDVGENRVQEALPKMDAVTCPVRWHLIGHLQRNKVKALARFAMLHSLDRASLADAVHAFAVGAGRTVEALVQVNVAGEATKGGYALPELPAEAERLRGLTGIRVRGVMTMAPLDADEATLRAVFRGAREARDVLRAAGHDAQELSMGMSNDFEVAVEEGATCVRLGTVLFGARAA
ncbi:MAG TPA: YggS family pyridoxal phosphate-dependent enzyme [Gemmatimonadaceae bacterium]|jgi:pyridoxal phosphate enzyme (YggS family)|nr:YggS family pyridoxal phosphate-dependent enzyme [Gemmatimonadaceae bacterium]